VRIRWGFLLLASLACSREDASSVLNPVHWPGQDGTPVGLDQALVVEFDHPLRPGLRTGCFSLRTEAGEECPPLDFEVVKRQLVLHPRLPRQSDLQDGTLHAGTRYQLLLRGFPHLAGLTSADGLPLVGDRLIRFETLPAGAPEALAGDGTGGMPLRLAFSIQGGVLPVDPDGIMRIPVRHGIDPRSLSHPARLQRRGLSPEMVPLSLGENLPDRALLEVHVGQWSGIATLELPAGLEGLGGRRFLQGDRLLRLRGSG